MKNPYQKLPANRYWRSGVADGHIMDVEEIYSPKFLISKQEKVASAGSCFAQHVAGQLKKRGYDVLDVEPAPNGLPPEIAKKYGYGIYSARYGNLYTSRQFLQLLRDCETLEVRMEDIWESKGRYYDALRPAVEPDGLDSPEEVIFHRRAHLRNVAALYAQTDIVVFTLGLTESWMNIETGTVYPTAPGVIAGDYDESKYKFVNFSYTDIIEDMRQIRAILKAKNPNLKFLITVSPVPLTATATGNHVLVATTYSKSVLRAVCGALYDEYADIDYFPSYELIASPASRGFFYDPNMRSVNNNGVEFVMGRFFLAQNGGEESVETEAPPARLRVKRAANRRNRRAAADDVVCEEALLEAFAK
jgi:hypothetical protein